MKMANLEMTKAERKEYNTFGPKDEMGPMYPYGTTLCLDKDHLADLGIKSAHHLPKAGTEVTITAKGYIKSVQSENRDGDEDSLQVEIQVTSVGFETLKTPASRTADKLDELGA